MSGFRHGGLGRGLSALIPTASADPAGSREAPAASADLHRTAGLAEPEVEQIPGLRVVEVPIAEVRANARQPRLAFDEDALAELAHSIREFGVLQPIVVRPGRADDDGGAARFELVMGERRLRAAEMAGLSVVPAIVRETADDAMLRDALLENVHRAALNPLEEAAAYRQLLDDFATTHDELATRIGRSRSQVTNTIRLLNLPVPVQRRVAAGVLSAGHARALLALTDPDAQDELASRIVAEGLSVRTTEEEVALAARGPARPRARRTSAGRLIAPGLDDLAERLSDSLDTRVRVDLGRRKGRITVEFASVDDLERIVAMIAPSLATVPSLATASAAGSESASAAWSHAAIQPVDAAVGSAEASGRTADAAGRGAEAAGSMSNEP